MSTKIKIKFTIGLPKQAPKFLVMYYWKLVMNYDELYEKYIILEEENYIFFENLKCPPGQDDFFL